MAATTKFNKTLINNDNVVSIDDSEDDCISVADSCEEIDEIETSKELPSKNVKEAPLKNDKESVIPTTSMISNSSSPSAPSVSSTSNTMKTPTNRRKTQHQPLKIDDGITFESVVMAEDPPPPLKLAKTPENSIKPTTVEMKNPNIDLMKKVAFLRVCVNYMMLNLGKKELVFNKPFSLKFIESEYFK